MKLMEWHTVKCGMSAVSSNNRSTADILRPFQITNIYQPVCRKPKTHIRESTINSYIGKYFQTQYNFMCKCGHAYYLFMFERLVRLQEACALRDKVLLENQTSCLVIINNFHPVPGSGKRFSSLGVL